MCEIPGGLLAWGLPSDVSGDLLSIEMGGHQHTVVIGGGVVGVSAAYYLASRGEQVTLLEQGEICSGCSRGNAGQITPGHLPLPQPGTLSRNLRWLLSSTSPLYIAPRLDPALLHWLWSFQRACNRSHLLKATEMLCKLGGASAVLFDELSRELDLDYQCTGRLEVCRSAKTFAAACEEAEVLEPLGFATERLHGREVREFEPALDTDVAGAVYYRESGYCDPQRFVLQLAEAAGQMGAHLRAGTPVRDLRTENGRVVSVILEQGAEEVEADAVVLACGSWTPRLARRVGLRLPVQPGKGYHLDLARRQCGPCKPVVLLEERIFVTPIGDSLRLAGTMEFSGFNLEQRSERLQMLTVGAGRYFSGVPDAHVRSRWCHLRPMTPDGLPVIGRAPATSNLWIATGHGMLGLTQGPITGKLLAECIVDGRPSIDLHPLRPERFQAKGRTDGNAA